MYQQSMSAGNLIEDFHRMLTGDDEKTRYLYRLSSKERQQKGITQYGEKLCRQCSTEKEKDLGSVFAAGSSNGGRHIAEYLYRKRLGFSAGNHKESIRSDDWGKQQTILLQLRLPRTILAAVLGGALALSGYLLQTFFHNPIAGPFVLGISSGAKMVVALVMVFFSGQRQDGEFGRDDRCGICRGDAFHGLCPVDVEADQADVHAGGQRRDDRIYLLGGDGAGGDVCPGCGHCKSS